MTIYTERTNAILSRLQDLARDLESHLGLASRTQEVEPMFNRANHFPPSGYDAEHVGRTRAKEVTRFVTEYRVQAGRAAFAVRDLQVPGVTLTAEDAKAANAVNALVAAFHEVNSHADAVALVATFGEA